MSLHEQRDRASSFGADPERYDRARPSYPAELVEHLLDLVDDGARPVRVLDVGCGTGIASRAFLAAGAEVLGVEPDPRMAAVARRSGVEGEVAGFEDWDPAGRTFDLLVAGQAWHWVDPELGPRRAADALRPGGVLAPFWNQGIHAVPPAEEFDRIYAELGPERGDGSAHFGGRLRDVTVHLPGIAATGAFGPAEVVTFSWERSYTRDEWLDQLPSHSNHRLMDEADLRRLLDAVGELIDRAGGSTTTVYDCVALIARRT
mgnify:CR=1 FL=1